MGWFGILGRTAKWQERVWQSKDPSKRTKAFGVSLQELASRAMAGVLAYLSLPRSLERICSDFSDSALFIWKEPLQRMLAGLNFQQGVLYAARSVAAQDVVKPFLNVKTKGCRGVRVRPDSMPAGIVKLCLGTRTLTSLEPADDRDSIR